MLLGNKLSTYSIKMPTYATKSLSAYYARSLKNRKNDKP